MKKMKVILMSVAILGAVTSAFTTRPKVNCVDMPQWYEDTSGWHEAGEIGRNYACTLAPQLTCTYYIDPSSGLMTPCRLGNFVKLTVATR